MLRRKAQADEEDAGEGNVGNARSTLDNKFYEVCDYYLRWPLIAYSKFYLVNKQAWEALPPDLQAIVTDAANTMVRRMWEEEWMAEFDMQKELAAKGMQVVEISPEEIAKATAIIEAKVWPEWLEKAGDDGKALLDIFLKYSSP